MCSLCLLSFRSAGGVKLPGGRNGMERSERARARIVDGGWWHLRELKGSASASAVRKLQTYQITHYMLIIALMA